MRNVSTVRYENLCLNTEWIHGCLDLQLKWEKKEIFRLNCVGGRSIRKADNWKKKWKQKKKIFCSIIGLIYLICFSLKCIIFSLWHCGLLRVMTSTFLRFLDHTQWRTTACTMFSGRMIISSQRQPDNTQHSKQTNLHAPGGIRNHSISRRAAADLPFKPRVQWDRLLNIWSFYSVVHWQ